MRRSGSNWFRALAVLSASAAFAAGCGDDTESESGSSGTSTTASNGSDTVVAEAQAAIDKAYEGTFREPPAEGPPAQKGKNVWVIPCIASAPGCALPMQAIQEAGKSDLGWDVTLADGKADPAHYNTVIKQAIADKADGIVLGSIDCPAVKQSLSQAKEAGVKIVGVYSFDCSDPSVGEEPLFDYADIYGTTPDKYYTEWGTLSAQYIIAKTQGKAEIINWTGPTFLTGKYKGEGFEAEIKKCSGCKIVTDVPSPATDNASGIAAQKFTTSVQQYPKANVVHMWADSKMLATAQASAAAQKNRDLIVGGGEGNEDNMALIRSGAQTFAVGIPAKWLGYAGADALNRLFAGETAADIPDQGLGFQIIDKEHGLPEAEGEAWKPSIDFESAYKKVWAGQ